MSTGAESKILYLPADTSAALDCARHLVACGVPLFLAKPDLDAEGNWRPDGGHQGTGYWLPKAWQRSAVDPRVVDRWKPGMALCAVTGHLVDLLDVDPRNGGRENWEKLRQGGMVPRSYGQAHTPSGGTHDLIASLGVRSLDKVLPGVDIKAGNVDGQGRGFLFIAPTVKLSKSTGELGAYVWSIAPDLDGLVLIGGDDSGARLADLMGRRSGREYIGSSYGGPSYAELGETERALADSCMESTVELWRGRLAEAVEWAEGRTDEKLRGWEKLSRDWAWVCAKAAATPWTPWTGLAAEAAYLAGLPEEMYGLRKWYPGIVAKAAAGVIEPPWWADFLPLAESGDEGGVAEWPSAPPRLDDAHLVAWMAHKGLGGDWCWAGGLGWMHWDGRRWSGARDEDTREAIRLAVIDACHAALAAGADRDRMQRLYALLSNARISAITSLMRGVVSVDGGAFDQQADLLNCANGVVDLRTGELRAHTRELLLTRITLTVYVPGATHPDWVQALDAMEPEVAKWMQVRFGQAATGWPTSDDVLPVGQGSGSNGKSSLLAALYTALGEHMTQVPEKLLRANPGDHPTELMSLYGARVAVIDETPEAGQLNVGRLKAVLGQSRMTARAVYRDNVTWRATHSLFLMTNYVPNVAETDHGTWRRLALVRFAKQFARDDSFRARLERGDDGVREAVLAWVVEGARRWYAEDRILPRAPERVEADTRSWRCDTDLVLAYLQADRVRFDPTACVMATELHEDFNAWLVTQRNKPWSEKLFQARFGDHEETARNMVYKERPKVIKGLVRRFESVAVEVRPAVWRGITWN